MEPRLKENEIDELIALHKSLKKKNDADKIKCLILWGKGWSWLQIKEALLISDHYISNIIKDFKTLSFSIKLLEDDTKEQFYF